MEEWNHVQLNEEKISPLDLDDTERKRESGCGATQDCLASASGLTRSKEKLLEGRAASDYKRSIS